MYPGTQIGEKHIRPLTSLPAEAQPIVWQRAVETAPNGKVTAKHVEEAAETMEILTPTGVIPKAESVVRPLTSLPAEAQPIVWQRALFLAQH